ncbi:hypothetical protein NDGK_00087 [Clostridiales bacterium CHKCI001]|nr:hypothetical protein NDGK_00087 [Clostridiales bacterium CHKCI001]
MGKEFWAALIKDESGIGVVEIILILVVLIALVLIFKEQIKQLVDDIFKNIQKNSNSVMDGY